jgi:hypothetical protein
MQRALPFALFVSANLALAPLAGAQASNSVAVTAQWDQVTQVSVTVPTTQHLANAFTLRSSPLNKRLLQDLKDLHTQDTRLQLWFSVPLQVVPELQEPTAAQSFWDFTYIDPVVEDYFANTQGRHNVNIGTIPRWMFKVPPVDLPTDPAASLYAYTRGTSGDLLKDPTGKQFGEYQARIFAWYTHGGFTDELGKFHKSTYHYKIDYWGVMNEQSIENHLSIEQYTRLYDQTVIAIRKIDPRVEFIAPEFAGIQGLYDAERYFLDPKNHDPAALPIQWFSFHNYVMATNDTSTWQAAYFTGKGNPFGAPAGDFGDALRQVMEIRNQLSPETKIAVDELGTFNTIKPIDTAHFDMENNPATTKEPYNAYDPLYWVASGGNWAANFLTAEKLGIPILSMTQMVGAPTQSESCSMIDWDTAAPNAHYWVLWLVNRNFGPGDKLVATTSPAADVIAQASITAAGRKLLLINTSNHAVTVDLGGVFAAGALSANVVDGATGENPPRADKLPGPSIELAPFAVAVVAPAAH